MRPDALHTRVCTGVRAACCMRGFCDSAGAGKASPSGSDVDDPDSWGLSLGGRCAIKGDLLGAAPHRGASLVCSARRAVQLRAMGLDGMPRKQGPLTFAKRQRERAKQAERQEKLARKIDRNARKRAEKRSRDAIVPAGTAVAPAAPQAAVLPTAHNDGAQRVTVPE